MELSPGRMLVSTLLVLVFAVMMGISLVFPSRGTVLPPECGTGPTMQLMAQAVPDRHTAAVCREVAARVDTANARIVTARPRSRSRSAKA